MGSLRKKTSTRAVPTNAELIERTGERVARWVDGRGKKKNAKPTSGPDGTDRHVVASGKWEGEDLTLKHI